MEGAEDVIETDGFSLDNVFPLDRRETTGGAMGDNNPVFDCGIISCEFGEDFASLDTAGICILAGCRFSVKPGHVFFKESESFVG